MFKKYDCFLLGLLFIFCTETKAMDGCCKSLFDFSQVVLKILQGDSFYHELQHPLIQPHSQSQNQSSLQPLHLPIVWDNNSVKNNPEPETAEANFFIIHNNNNMSVKRYLIEQHKQEEIKLFGCGQVYLYQVATQDEEYIEISAQTTDIKRFCAMTSKNKLVTTIGPNCANDVTTYMCYLGIKNMPKFVLKDKVGLKLSSNIVSELLIFELKGSACIQPSSNRIKTPMLSVVVRNYAKIFDLQGVAVDQDLSLFDNAECTSNLKSYLVRIKACGKSKACVYLPNDFRRPSTIKGNLFGFSVLKYSGNPNLNSLNRGGLCWIESVDND